VFKNYFSSKPFKLIFILAACGLLVFLNPSGIFAPVRNIFATIFYPFEKIFYMSSRKLADSGEFLGSISKLRSENERLIREKNFLSSQLAALTDEKKENENLRRELDLLPRKKYDLEAAFIIGQDPQKMGSWLIIDKGSTDGVFQGMPAIVSEGIIVGKIGEVSLKSSKVNLLTNSLSSVNAADLNTGAKGIIRGEFGLGVIFDMVAQTDVLNVDDQIVTSGLGGDIPRGLLVGKIQEIRSTQDKLFQQALVIPQVKYSGLEQVFVIKNAK
jgi:rod shape-determining protein MreC